jgi:Ca2+-transporting ATPase
MSGSFQDSCEGVTNRIMRREENVQWHALDREEVLRLVAADAGGLTDLQAQERLRSHGPNLLGSVKSVSLVELVVKQLKSPLIYLLAAAAAISLATGHLVDSAVIAVVVVLNTILGTIQEWRAERSLEALRNLAAPKAKVRRDGHDQEIPASEVVPGDILMLETGARVAADARVLDSQELAINESTLTGESGLIYKNSGCHSEYEPLAERGNMVWMSTAVAGGRGQAVVVATGIHTAIGEIAEQVRTLERDETPLQRRLGTLGTKLGIASVLLAAVLFVMGVLRGYDVVEMVLFSVAAAVAAIPEGLPAIVSITLALGLQRMAKRNAIVRRLPAVETLGSTTVICSDKTGTITKNEMTVSRLWVGGKTYVVTGQGFDPTGEIRLQEGSEDSGVDRSPDLRMLMTIGGVANNARLLEHQNSWQVEGNPSEGALLVLAAKAGYDLDQLQIDEPRIHEIPFSSEQKYMATLNEAHAGERSVIYVKGAPEQLIGFSTKMMQDGTVAELNESRRHHIEMVGDSFARDGLRVIAAAFRESPNDLKALNRAKVETGLTFVGLWGMVDPIRPEAIEATRKAQEAGIRVVMITGDKAVTASVIASQVGIGDADAKALTGPEIDDMSGKGLARHALEVGTFARVSPAHKLKILEALKQGGEIVAMTGDGVNDAPALKGADIGIAMGKTGTEVAKEAADIVLTDDNLQTIVNAVEEGRVIFGNLQRTIVFLITTNLGEIITLAAALFLGLPLPMTAAMILWINLVTDGACTVPLGLEPRHLDVLNRPPLPPEAGILDGRQVFRILLLAPLVAAGTLGLFAYYLETGNVMKAQTVAFTALAAFQWYYAFAARTTQISVFSVGLFSNHWVVLGVASAIVLQLLVIHTSFGQTVFHTVPLTMVDWGRIFAVSASIFILDEILKFFRVYRPTTKPVNGRSAIREKDGTACT